MKKLEIFDPAMCCSTGVCGPAPDQELVTFAGELKALSGVAEIRRFNLSQQPGAFVANQIVQKILLEEGPDCLPLILIDGQLAMRGVYPTKQQLRKLLGAPEEAACCGGKEATECCDDSGSSCC